MGPAKALTPGPVRTSSSASASPPHTLHRRIPTRLYSYLRCPVAFFLVFRDTLIFFFFTFLCLHTYAFACASQLTNHKPAPQETRFLTTPVACRALDSVLALDSLGNDRFDRLRNRCYPHRLRDIRRRRRCPTRQHNRRAGE